MKTLLLDIETEPMIATVWGLYDQNIANNQILKPGGVICWAAKWYGSDDTFFDSVHQSSKFDMIEGIYELLDEADAVVHYNGKRFDMPLLNREFIKIELPPPSPYKNIDLLSVVKSNFRFPSNKLEYISRELNIGRKVKHEGHSLWLKCMDNNEEAWRKMEAYNVHDVELLETLYMKLLPWIKSPLNYSTFNNKHACTNCGSQNVQRRGTAVSTSARYQRFQCLDCGGWSRSRTSEKNADQLLTPLS